MPTRKTTGMGAALRAALLAAAEDGDLRIARQTDRLRGDHASVRRVKARIAALKRGDAVIVDSFELSVALEEAGAPLNVVGAAGAGDLFRVAPDGTYRSAD